jgi:hypothetical protein
MSLLRLVILRRAMIEKISANAPTAIPTIGRKFIFDSRDEMVSMDKRGE